MSGETLTEFDQEALRMVHDIRMRLAGAATASGASPSAPANELLTTAEVATCLKLSRRTIWR